MAELPPFPKAGEWSKPDHLQPVNEGQPTFWLADHPALMKSKIAPPSKADIGKLYKMMTGEDPPATIREWRDRILARGGEIPPYAKDACDALDDADSID